MESKKTGPPTKKGKPVKPRALGDPEVSEIPEVFEDVEKTRKSKQRLKTSFYSASEDKLPASLTEQLNQLEKFWTSAETSQRHEKPIRPKTYKTYKKNILSFLGWLINVQATDLKNIKLEHLTDQGLLSDFVTWGLEQRGNSYGWALNIAQSVLLIASWQYSDVTTASQDVPAIAQLRNYISILRRQYSGELETKKGEQARLAEDACELTDELRQKISAYLRQDCTEIDSAGKERSEITLLRSWQRYLITSILLFCPIRLQTLCQLELARSLLRESDGAWVIVTETQHKTGYSGIPVKIRLPQLEEDLTTWIEKWRPRIKTENNFTFTKLGSNRLPGALGQPLTERDVWELVVRATEKATLAIFGTPTRINPSMLRQSLLELPSKTQGFSTHTFRHGLSHRQISEGQRIENWAAKHISHDSNFSGMEEPSLPKNYRTHTAVLLDDLIQQIVHANLTALSENDAQTIAVHLQAVLEIINK